MWDATRASRLPFFYGWLIVGCAICSAFARQGSAVATLSVFVNPMSEEFGWSRAAMSGAVSLGGVLAALTAPVFGRVVDRHGARTVLIVGACVVGASCVALAGTHSLIWFYVAFTIGRLTFASPFDIGISAAVANWFVQRRALAMSIVNLGLTIGLAIMPFLAFTVIDGWGWRASWVTIGVLVIVVGVLPNYLFMRRRPEDIGLRPDGVASARGGYGTTSGSPEARFTRAEALRTPALWLLMFYTALVFPVQAGLSLHQAPHLIQQGLSPGVAAGVVSTFSLAAALSGLGFGWLARRFPIRFGLAVAAAFTSVSGVLMVAVNTPTLAFFAGAVFGAGMGGLLTLLPVVWADYYGREHFGAIRGITLPVQVVGQALGPILAGVMYDVTGNYRASLLTLSCFAALAAVLVTLARPPPR